MNAHAILPRSDPGGSIDRVVVLHDYPHAEGGAGTLATLAAREFAARGVPVTFFSGASDLDAISDKGIEHAGATGRPLLDLPASTAILQGFHNRDASARLSTWIANYDTPRTVYHLHNWSQILSPAIFAALRPVESRLVVTCHDFFNLCPNGGVTDFRRTQPCELRPMSARCIATDCDRRSRLHKLWRTARHANLVRLARFARSEATFTFIHQAMRDRFVEGGFAGRDLAVLPNPVEPWTESRVRAEDNAGFLFVGRLSRDKGADIAAEAAAQSGVPMTLAGTGELFGSLRHRARGVRLAGWCDRSDLRALARNARAVVVPSRVTEPFGLVIIEAAASGVPVIVSDRAYLAADAERLGFGLAFDPAQDGALAAILDRISRDRTAVERMSKAGHAIASRLALSPEDWADRLLVLFERKLGHISAGAGVPLH
ncbi:glycosyltransferase family 4 protein [Qipengyuania soli]|uniref:Glycosyltransferase family 4 protein n=1 Tax=Qipengyuania soli TaxID=2782568 RepID=A0A7S8F4U1_9SPHN|nr:glycosyltransferase family 4 protein [Qipengyuania soli]QPC99128.1 glycosyltransferase family 4 protein [Qipengyuania soli]